MKWSTGVSIASCALLMSGGENGEKHKVTTVGAPFHTRAGAKLGGRVEGGGKGQRPVKRKVPTRRLMASNKPLPTRSTVIQLIGEKAVH